MDAHLKDKLADKLIAAFSSAVHENIIGIAAELTAADDGKLSLSIPIKLSLNAGRVAGTGSVTYSRKFTGDFEFITEDPHQEPLPI